MRKCMLTAFLIIVAVMVVLWVFDTMFNGALLNFVGLLSGSLSRGPWTNRSVLLGCGFLVMLLIILVGIVIAYRTYMTQHTLYLEARAEAERSKALIETEMQRKGDLITYLAHDLKTPLASVIGYLNLLDEAPELPVAQRGKYVGITLDKAYRLEQLIDELFEIIRFNLQTITLNTERINLPFMLRQLADEFYPILLPQGKSIRVEAAEGLTMTGDSDKLARVFNNILKNAAIYSDVNTEIEISATQTETEVIITFKNHGAQIPPHKQAVIFEKFYRLDTARSTKTGGAGLGLAIAKEIVEAHHGAISVASDAGRTVFTTRFPINL